MTVTLRYWAAAKAAAGTDQQVVDAGTLADALAKARQRQDGKLSLVLERCSFLVDGDPVGGRDHDQVLLPAGSVVDVLPPFAGG